MGRAKREAAGEVVYHVLNRANGRATLFHNAADFDAFERILEEAVKRFQVRLLSYSLMPNHWHLVVWPREDGDLSRFMAWLTLTHTQRWKIHYGCVGLGHLYQGRFKSFPIEVDEHFLIVCRYVERNALRAKLVERAEDWRWCSFWRRESGDEALREMLAEWPVERPADWVQMCNSAQTDAEEAELRASVKRGRPYGGEKWVAKMAGEMGLASTLRKPGRPRGYMG
jgi:putative transposase